MIQSNKSRPKLAEYKEAILQKDRVWLSKGITLIESRLPSDRMMAEQLVNELLPYTGNSLRIGITGVPGVGKSTFIEAFGSFLTSKGESVAVLAIDPSSQRSKGSIMGDKTRMNSLTRNPSAYVRPSPAGGRLGGVADKTREAMLLCEAAGFTIIIIETVGVGQSETVVREMVDFFLLMMLPGAGDELQGIKKGIMEMADALVINKADGAYVSAAKRAVQEYKQALHLFPVGENGWQTQVLTCSALEMTGLSEVWETVQSYAQKTRENGSFESIRVEQNIRWMHYFIRSLLEEQFELLVKDEKDLLVQKIKANKCSAISAGRALFEKYNSKLGKK